MPSFVSSRLLLSTLAVPVGAAFLTAYLYNHPLPASRSRTIQETNTLSPSTLKSPTIKRINPRNYQALTDTRTIFLPQTDIKDLTDEEILARFTKGFYNGWIITPERLVMGMVEFFGSTVLPVGFTSIENRRPRIPVFARLSRSSLPPRHTPIFGGNFMVLDFHLKSEDQDPLESFVEIGYGDDRKGFAGMHRFEVSRRAIDQGVIVSYSSISCNPGQDKRVFPWVHPNFVARFHCFYALCLFRDGVREILAV